MRIGIVVEYDGRVVDFVVGPNGQQRNLLSGTSTSDGALVSAKELARAISTAAKVLEVTPYALVMAMVEWCDDVGETLSTFTFHQDGTVTE
jgi:hypothetical protein